MASWTDKIPEFNPYVQQLPVEEMLKVGMYKQGKYDEGIKKQLIETFDVGWKGNVKARFHSAKLDNKYRVRKENEPIFRAQNETYNYYRNNMDIVVENL